MARSAPVIPVVEWATSSTSTPSSSETPFRCTFRIPQRPLKSGRPTVTVRSKRPGLLSAESSASGLFVAARTITGAPESVWKPSISVSSWFSVCSRSSLATPATFEPLEPDLWRPTASSSSMKMTAGAFLRASEKSCRMRRPPWRRFDGAEGGVRGQAHKGTEGGSALVQSEHSARDASY